MGERDERVASGKISYNTVGRRYYVVTESSGVPAADFYFPDGSARGGMIVPRDWDNSGDIRF